MRLTLIAKVFFALITTKLASHISQRDSQNLVNIICVAANTIDIIKNEAIDD